MSQLHRVFVVLGSNIAPEVNLPASVALLRERCRVHAVSPVYETAPVGDTEQANFLNAAVLLETALSPEAFRRQVIIPIEQQLGRKRDPANKNAPRTIDLDIALWDEGSFDYGENPRHVPDENITRFIHVARPLADLAPGYVHAEDGRTLAEIAASLPAEGIKRRDDLTL